MSLRFAIASALPTITTFVPLTAEEHAILWKARVLLVECLLIQERYGQVVEDYFDLERVVERHILQASESNTVTWCDAMDRLNDVSRHLTHLLGTSAAYLDVTKTRLCQVFGGTHAVPSLFREQCDRHLNDVGDSALWRTMRGHSLHRGSPVSKVTWHGRLISEIGENPTRVEHSIKLGVDRAALDDRSVNKEIRKALELVVDDADARMLAQQECRSIELIHQDLLQKLEPFHSRATNAVAGAINRFETRAAMTGGYPTLVTYDEAGERSEELHLSLQWTERYELLRSKYAMIPMRPTAIVVTKGDQSSAAVPREPNEAERSAS